MIVGYARTSTVEQEAGFEAQKRDLEAAGCTKIFSEQLSSVDASRPQLEAALEFVREGDVFVATKLDRISRSVAGFIKIVEELERKKVGLRILALNLDTETPTGRLTLNLFASIAQFEREIMLERQREGIAKAKAEGKYRAASRCLRKSWPRPASCGLKAWGRQRSPRRWRSAGQASTGRWKVRRDCLGRTRHGPTCLD